MNCCQLEQNTKEAIIHLIQSHLDTNVYRLNLGHQDFIDNDVLKEIAASPTTAAINYLNLQSTNVSYNGIVALWNSLSLGSLVSDVPTYERHTGNPIVKISIEVGNTKVIKQHQQKLFTYPLPLLRDFEITYGHRGLGESWKMFGLKQIILLNNGVELASNK